MILSDEMIELLEDENIPLSNKLMIIKNIKQNTNKEIFDKLTDEILVSEGGYVNNKNDSGGETNMGITIGTFKRYAEKLFNTKPTSSNLKKLTQEQAKMIYKEAYWKEIQADKIDNENIAYIFYDFSINSGNKTAITYVQKALNGIGIKTKENGKIGKQMLDSINNADSYKLFNEIKKTRMSYYDQIIKNNPKNKVFEVGWKKRIEKIKYQY